MDVLVVDGYNIIGAWDELDKLKQIDMALARDKLIEQLGEYQAFTKNRVIIVFDALYVKGAESKQRINNLELIYTKENETADECIERLVKSLKNVRNEVYVATSDYLEQRTIFSRGALRISARELEIELASMDSTVKEQIDRQRKRAPKRGIIFDKKVYEKLEQLRRGDK